MRLSPTETLPRIGRRTLLNLVALAPNPSRQHSQTIRAGQFDNESFDDGGNSPEEVIKKYGYHPFIRRGCISSDNSGSSTPDEDLVDFTLDEIIKSKK